MSASLVSELDYVLFYSYWLCSSHEESFSFLLIYARIRTTLIRKIVLWGFHLRYEAGFGGKLSVRYEPKIE